MNEGEPPAGIEQPAQPDAQIQLSADEWELVRASVDDYLRSYLEADYTWWDPDDDRRQRLQALLDKLHGRLPSPGGDEQLHPWPIASIGRFLGVDPLLRHHWVYGLGLRFDIDAREQHLWARLDLYPERMIARYRSALTRLDILGVTSVTLSDDHHVLIESAQGPTAAHLMVYRGGRLTYVQFELIQDLEP